MRLVLVADHIGIWVSGLFSKFFMLFLSSICGGFWEETLGSEGGVLAWLVCVKKQTNKPKKQRFPGRAWMMNATHVT